MARTIDTRFFLTHYLADTDHLRLKTSRKMFELQRETAIVPTIVLHEVYKFVYENIGKDVADLRVNSILTSSFEIVDLSPRIALSSAKLRCQHRDLPTADSIVAATSLETKSKRVLSDDPHFREVSGIRCEWI